MKMEQTVSNDGNVSDMELTSGMKWKKTHNAVDMHRHVSDMALTSEGLQREFFNPLDASNNGNVSDMEFTSLHLPAYEDGTDRVFRNVGI